MWSGAETSGVWPVSRCARGGLSWQIIQYPSALILGFVWLPLKTRSRLFCRYLVVMFCCLSPLLRQIIDSDLSVLSHGIQRNPAAVEESHSCLPGPAGSRMRYSASRTSGKTLCALYRTVVEEKATSHSLRVCCSPVPQQKQGHPLACNIMYLMVTFCLS